MPADWLGPAITELRTIGAGRRGRVVLARDQSGEFVVIRYLPALAVVDRRRAARLRADLAALRRVDSRHVARPRRYSEDPRLRRARRYVSGGYGAAVVSDAVQGVSLRRVLERQRALPPRAALVVFAHSLLGLAAVHSLGLVMRSPRPSGVLVGRDIVTLADAGTAVLADPAEPARRAPELWQAQLPSAATDVYAATCIFVECLVGHPTYRGPALSSLMGGHTTAPIPMAEVPEPLRPLLAGGLAKDPAYRLTASALAAEAQRVAAAAYGAGWEQAGLAELGAIAGPLIEPFPPAPAGPPAPASDPPMPVSDPSAPASGPLMPASDLPMPVSGPSAPASGPPVPKSRPKSRPEPAPGVAAGPRAAGSGRSGAGGRSSGRGGRSRRPALAALPAAGLAIVLASAVSAALDGREPSAPPAHGRPSARTAAPPATHRPPARPRTTPLATIPRPAPRRTAPHPTAPPRRTTPPPAGCTAAPGLTLSPSSGGPGTLITVVGSGVVRGGRVDVHFHADQMGSTRTTADGCFQLTAPIPNADFYANFGTQAYDIYVTEYDADGRYAGNGPGRQRFLLTGS